MSFKSRRNYELKFLFLVLLLISELPQNSQVIYIICESTLKYATIFVLEEYAEKP